MYVFLLALLLLSRLLLVAAPSPFSLFTTVSTIAFGVAKMTNQSLFRLINCFIRSLSSQEIKSIRYTLHRVTFPLRNDKKEINFSAENRKKQSWENRRDLGLDFQTAHRDEFENLLSD